MLIETHSVAGHHPPALPESTQFWAILSQYETYSARIAQALIWIPIVLLLGVVLMKVSLWTVVWAITGTISALVLTWWVLSSFAKSELTGSLYKEYLHVVRHHIIGTIEAYAFVLALIPLLAMFVFNVELL